MTALEFKKVWQEYVDKLQSQTDWLALWSNDSKWTAEVQNNVNENDWHWSVPMEQVLQNEFPGDEHTLAPEHRKIDFVAASELKSPIESMWADGSLILRDAVRFGFLEVMIEFENDFADCFREMIKLTKHRARLKVLVTYDYEHKSEPHSDWIDVATRNWYAIIRESQERLPEPGVEYLLIVGQIGYADTSPQLVWKYFNAIRELVN